MKILIIEDDALKFNQISDFLNNTFSEVEVVWKKSYQSGLQELVYNPYSLVLLDMSMHIYDKGINESGGTFEKYAGQMMLREVEMLEIDTKIIVVTMFDLFADGKTLSELKAELSEEFDVFYIDTVYYNISQNRWRNELRSLIVNNVSGISLSEGNSVSLNILIVDDSDYKTNQITDLLKQISPNSKLDIVGDKLSALINLKNHKYDLLIVDMLLPIVNDEDPVTNGGEMLLGELEMDESLKHPASIVVLTEYEDLQEKFRNSFEDIAAIKFDLTSGKWKGHIKRRVHQISRHKHDKKLIVYCEDKNDIYYNMINLNNIEFRGLKGGSRSVYLAAKNEKDKYSLRDKDYLTTNEIEKLQQLHYNYFILEYYCFENYIFHPENIAELNLDKFDKKDYVNAITVQKNEKLLSIVSDFKLSRNSYSDFIDNDKKTMLKESNAEIIKSLESDEFEIFYPFFDMKGTDTSKGFDSSYLESFNLNKNDLASTMWFQRKMKDLLHSIVK